MDSETVGLYMDQLRAFYMKSTISADEVPDSAVITIRGFDDHTANDAGIVELALVVGIVSDGKARMEILVKSDGDFQCESISRLGNGDEDHISRGLTHRIRIAYRFEKEKPIYWFIERNILAAAKNCRRLT